MVSTVNHVGLVAWSDEGTRFSPHELRHRDPNAIAAPILSDPAAMARIREALAYFDDGNPGIPWEQVGASSYRIGR
jgi:hypothetical protein